MKFSLLQKNLVIMKKLVALVEAANIANGKTVMLRSPSGDSDITVLLILHEFDRITVLIDNAVGKSRKFVIYY